MAQLKIQHHAFEMSKGDQIIYAKAEVRCPMKKFEIVCMCHEELLVNGLLFIGLFNIVLPKCLKIVELTAFNHYRISLYQLQKLAWVIYHESITV